MSQVLINQHLAKLDRIKKIDGSDREGSVRKAFERRFADHKECVIDLLARVATVSVETVMIVGAMKGAVR